MTIEEKLGYYFFDKGQLRRALTSRAHALEQSPPGDDREAYTLLGGALVDAVLTELVIRAGHTTQTAIVTRKLELKQIEHLAKLSYEVGIGFVVKLSQAEKVEKAYDNSIVLAETLEAVIGAVYFDGGYSAARRTIHGLFKDTFPLE